MRTIATFWKPEEAHLLRLRLGEAGIPAFLQDEHVTQIHPWRAAAVGGVRLQVCEADFDAAKRLISETDIAGRQDKNPPDSDALECFSCSTIVAPGQTRCPKCGWSYDDEAGAPGFSAPES